MNTIYDSILFDLDGTLWDASSVTAETWVEVLKNHPGVSCAAEMNAHTVKTYMGLTNEELAALFFPDLPFDEAFALMQESCALENEWLPVRGGTLYPSVRKTLEALCKSGYRLFIVSNCQDGYIEAFLDAHGMRDVIGDWECSGRTGLPKADNIRAVMNRNGLKNAVYVGDTVSDAVGARGAEIPFVYCLYGFGEAYGRGKTDDYDAAVETIADLPALLRQRITEQRKK
ncbi:MAG: HAD family hydrolase [Clostridia bacterium]|nr:HAD family hydrolase [Clostridia bacterium]